MYDLNIRALRAEDFGAVKQIHEKFYESEFSFPNFVHNFMAAFVIENESGIVTLCGIRKIAEVIAMTDKDVSVRTRRASLLIGQEALSFIAGKENYDQLHVFVQDDTWKNQLIKSGFQPTKGQSLVLSI